MNEEVSHLLESWPYISPLTREMLSIFGIKPTSEVYENGKEGINENEKKTIIEGNAQRGGIY